jgi:HPt (histidine-containing phosphotransfer) domain-containing protein
MAQIFDRAAAIERVDGDISLLLDLVKLCREQCDSRMMVLMHDVRHKDLLAVKRHAHLLKGALGNVGAAAAYEAAVALENAARSECLDEVEPLANTLIEAINEFFVAVKREFES